MYLNPFNENFFGYKIIGLILDGLKDFFVGDEEAPGILTFLSKIFEFIKSILDFFLNFFDNLLSFFIHIFIPTDEQWQEIKESYSSLGELIKSKLPFVKEFQSSLDSAKNQVFASNDFLNIKMPSFKFFGGQTEEQQVFNVRDAYEPYRIKIRSLLALIVYGCGFVYLIKTVLNYNATATGIESAEVQSHLKSKGE